MSTKSLVCNSSIEKAIKSHNCQANNKHRINAGDLRLRVKNGRSKDYYCKECAEKIFNRDVEKLQLLIKSLKNNSDA